ncbi:MAG: secretin N-terminal domain-containing protein [Cyanobacteria bacterium J06649_4]
MKRRLNFRSLMFGGALAALAGPLAVAQSAIGATTVEGIALNQTAAGLALTLETSGDTPQVVTARSGRTLQADIAHAELQLDAGKLFTKQNPAPGIESIRLEAVEGDRVRLTVSGESQAPISEIQKSATAQTLSIRLDTRPGAKAIPSELPTAIETVPADATSSEPNGSVQPIRPNPILLTQVEQNGDAPEILIPEPEVIIDGAPISAPAVTGAPPFLPRAVAPPVGDLSVSEIDSSLDAIDLGTAERVPRLVLRDASAREVLSLLARAAGLNLAFSNNTEEGTPIENDVRVSLDIENEPVQNVFNYVLQLSGLEANRVGRTIFVGSELPDSARSLITRTIRLNQTSAEAAASFLSAQGAITQVPIEQVRIEVIGGNDGIPARTIETREPAILALQAEESSGPLLLDGLSIVTDSRLNAITLLGSPRQVQIATEFITQLDIRRRQVAVNLRVIDVDLNADDQLGASFSYGLGDTSFGSRAGLGILNFGGATPQGPYNESETNIGWPAFIFGGGTLQFAEMFLAQLQATVTNGQAKIITDPTLVVQEGQTANVNLTQDVITEVTTEIDQDETGGTITVETTKGQAGLQLSVNVERIGDNGFVTLSVNPKISAPTASQRVSGVDVTLLAERELESGTVRVRDGQTLVLSGIIQESDRTITSKVPILGDIPILGTLFRSTERLNERRELIVLLTPQILDDSDESAYGYSYTPGEDVQQLLEERQIQQ